VLTESSFAVQRPAVQRLKCRAQNVGGKSSREQYEGPVHQKYGSGRRSIAARMSVTA
jgi:hypothetical protein